MVRAVKVLALLLAAGCAAVAPHPERPATPADPVAAFAEDYKRFLADVKTSREFVSAALALGREAGFRDLALPELAAAAARPGDLLFLDNRGKTLAMVVAGKRPVVEGLRFVGSHIDSPHYLLYPQPVQVAGDNERVELHGDAYGGTRSYHYFAKPLERRGVVAAPDGTLRVARLGSLAAPLVAIDAGRGLHGGTLPVVVAGPPAAGDRGDLRAAALAALKQQTGLEEADLVASELAVVPAFPPRDVGLDRALVGAYGQDDRACGYPALRALLEIAAAAKAGDPPPYTAVALFFDQEEVGSGGTTGMQSPFVEEVTGGQLEREGKRSPNAIRLALSRSIAISSDVTAAMDPLFAEVHEERNAAHVHRGLAIMKATGHGGKWGASEASAELVAFIRRVFDEAGVAWQMAEIGRVDQGGGGTIALFLAALGMDVVDIGIPVISMHSHFELASKKDLHAAKRAYEAFFRAEGAP